jgi:hypothetical protein
VIADALDTVDAAVADGEASPAMPRKKASPLVAP